MLGSVVAQGQRGMSKTVASREQGARGGAGSKEQGAKEQRRANSEEQGEWRARSEVRGQRSEDRKKPNTERDSPNDFIKVKAGSLRNRWSGEKIRPMEEKRKTLSARFARWTAELVLVFIGVYAAFWLNSYQQRQQDAERRDRILASIEQTLREGIESSKINRAEQQEPAAAEFRRALDAGEMPPLHPFVFITDYSSKRLRHGASIRRRPVARLADAYRAAKRRIGYPLGTEPAWRAIKN